MALFEKKKKNQTFTLPFFFVVLENGTLLSAAFMERWRDGWKSASERPIWSAFNGLEGEAREGGTVPFLPLLGAECCFWNILSGIIRGADFFDFLWLCLLYMNCFWGTRLAAPATIVLSQLDLFDIARTKWRILTVTCKQCISERLRVGFRGETAVRGGLILRSFFFVFFALFWTCFSPRTLYFVALRTLLRMSLIFQRSLPTPSSSQKCPPTPQINTQFGFFHSSPHLSHAPSTPLLYDPPTLPLRLWWTAVCTVSIGFLNWTQDWRNLLAGFSGQKDATRAIWMRNESESSASPSSPRK